MNSGTGCKQQRHRPGSSVLHARNLPEKVACSRRPSHSKIKHTAASVWQSTVLLFVFFFFLLFLRSSHDTSRILKRKCNYWNNLRQSPRFEVFILIYFTCQREGGLLGQNILGGLVLLPVSPPAHLHVVGMFCRLCLWHKSTELAYSFYFLFFIFCSCICFCLCGLTGLKAPTN